jgi:hypothetical protein
MRNPAEPNKASALIVEDPEILSRTPVIRNISIPIHYVAASRYRWGYRTTGSGPCETFLLGRLGSFGWYRIRTKTFPGSC